MKMKSTLRSQSRVFDNAKVENHSPYNPYLFNSEILKCDEEKVYTAIKNHF